MRDRGGSHDPQTSSELRAKDGTRERITSRGIGAGVAVNAGRRTSTSEQLHRWRWLVFG